MLKKAKKRIVTSTAMTRGIQGLSIDELKAKKSEAPERRKAQREATVRYVECIRMWCRCSAYGARTCVNG